MIRKILKYFLGGLFVISAFAKLIDYSATVELFESLFLTDAITTKIFLFILVVIELAIAYMIIENYIEKDFVFKTVVKLISVFMLVNIIFAIKGYNNCGCFGTLIISTPLASLGKNILLLIGLYFLRQKELQKQKIEYMK